MTLLGDLAAIPVAAGNGVDMEQIHGVNLLKRTVLGLNDEEVDDEDEGKATAAEDKTVEVPNVTDNELGEEGDEEVQEPVGCGGEGHARGSVSGGVELSNDGPDERTPCACKGDDEEAGEDDEDVSGGLVRCWIDKVADEGVDHEASKANGSTPHERLAATTLGSNVETEESTTNVDRVKDDLGNVGVAETGCGEDGRSVVEEEVGTSELLTGLENHAEHGTVTHARTSEDLDQSSVSTSHLLLELDADVVDLVVDLLVVRVDASKSSDDSASIFLATGSVGVTRRLWQQQDSTAKNDGPEERETARNSPLSTVAVTIVSTVVNL